MTLTLNHADILRDDVRVHLTRATLTSARPRQLHDHDFYELFWVQNGTVRHHLPSGVSSLTEGDAMFLRPGQPHGLQARGDEALVVTICIHPEVIEMLSKRHGQLQGHLFWSEGGPIQAFRDIRQLAALNQSAVALERSARDTLAAEAFLLPLCADVTWKGFPPGTPEWLARACLAAQEQSVFKEGAAGLVASSGKAHAHVSRMMRKYLGQTPSDYINAIRVSYSARALVTDSEPISQIAADCGLPNMSHFHKLFRATHGMTPLQYRQKYQRNVVQPA